MKNSNMTITLYDITKICSGNVIDQVLPIRFVRGSELQSQ